MHRESDFYSLLSLKLAGEASEEQLRLLYEIMKDIPDLIFLHDQMVNGSSYIPDNEQIESAFAANYAQRILSIDQKENAITNKRAKTSTKKIAYLVAACVISLFCFGMFRYSTSIKKPAQKITTNTEVTTPKGIKSHLTLPDGTKVFINAGSKVDYHNFFRNGSREITLSGEAFFEVMYDSSRPFIVHTQKADIRVLGTSFNVKSYPGEQFSTSLINGKIELVVNSDREKTFVLKPLQNFVINETSNSPLSPSEQKIEVTEIKQRGNVISETAWMSNKLVFTNVALEEIATELERYYGTTVIFKNQSTKQYKYTGIFEDMSLEEVMELLSASRKIDFVIGEDQVEIY